MTESGNGALRRGRAREDGLTCLLTMRCIGRQPLLEPRARDICVQSLLWLQRNRGILLHAFVVMPSHVHVVITLDAERLSKFLHSFKSFTASEINKALGREGSLWDEGARDNSLPHDVAVEAAVAYVEDNPVKAGMVERAEQYAWSSAAGEYRRTIDPWR